MAVWSSILWYPIINNLPPRWNGFIFILFNGSVIGSSGYWLLVRLFWLKSLHRADWLKTVALCVAATLASYAAVEVLNPRVDPYLIATVTWWFAFSISLYWSEMSVHVRKSTEATEGIS
jgi:hypothetical protein